MQGELSLTINQPIELELKDSSFNLLTSSENK